MRPALLAIVVAGVFAARASAQDGLAPVSGTPSTQMPGILKSVTYDQRLNERLPLDTPLTDEHGRAVQLGDYFGTRPVVLAFAYYTCPMLCDQVLNGMTSALGVLGESVGREFDVVVLSFDTRDTTTSAAAKKKTQIDRYKRAGTDAGWHFLVGDEAAVRRVTDAAGFHYAWDPRSQQFAHPSGIVVVTPDGRLSRYFFGIDFAPRDVKFALIESSAGRIGNAIDKLLLYCYHYNPETGSYAMVAMRAVRVGGAVTIVALIGFIAVALSREPRESPPAGVERAQP